VAYLRQRLIDTWNDLSQSIVNDAVDEWRTRVQACEWKRRTFQHLLWYFGLGADWLCEWTGCFISLYNKNVTSLVKL